MASKLRGELAIGREERASPRDGGQQPAIFEGFDPESPAGGASDATPGVGKSAGPDAVDILDLFQVPERPRAVAHCFPKGGSDPARRPVEERLRDLLQGRVG